MNLDCIMPNIQDWRHIIHDSKIIAVLINMDFNMDFASITLNQICYIFCEYLPASRIIIRSGSEII